MVGEKERCMTIQVYRSGKQWRWRMKADNGRKIGCSGEAYKNKGHCVRMAEKIIQTSKWEWAFLID